MKTKTESKNKILWPAIMGFDRFLIVVLVITLLAMGIQGVSGLTLTGTLESDAGWLSQNYGPTGAFGYGAAPNFRVVNIELTSNAKSFVHFDTDTYLTSYDSGAPSGAQTTMNLTSGSQVVATGSLGYQRLYNGAWPVPAEIAGYQWYQFDTWNITGLTGTKDLTVNYNHSAVYNMSYATIAYPSLSGAPSSYAFLYSPSGQIGPIAGNLTFNRDQPFKNGYYATKPLGIGIEGAVVKTVDGTNYPSRAYIVDGITSAPITSQGLVTASDFNFSISGETIKICVINSLGDWYNSSTLFSVPTPTVTPTTSVTPPPTGTFDIQFYVKDNGNSTPLQNTYVELHRNDVGDSINAGYTDVNGLITFAEIPRPTYAPGHTQMESRYWKTGYQYSTWSFNPTQIGNYFHTQYLVPDIGENPLVPATVNITVHSIDGSNGNANLASAYVEVYPNAPGPGGVIDWTYKLTGFTNASGLITFQNVPASAYNEIKTTKSGYSTDDYWIGATPLSDFHHNAYLTTFGITPTPTPLPQTGNYTLVISPTTVPYNGNTTGTISSVNDPTLAGIQQIWYAYGDPMSDPVNAFDFFESGSYSKALQYIKNSSGTWMGWDYATNTFSNNKGATIPNPNDLIFNGPGGTKTVYCTITLTNGIQYDLLGTVVVGAGAGQITTNVHSIDALTGGQLFNVKIDILNENTGAWKNGTYPAGQASITTPAGTYLSFYGYLAGWNNATSLHKIAVASPSYQLRFYETGVSPGVGNQTFHITVEDQSGNPLSGAVVAITEVGNATQTKATAEGGTTSFTLKQSTTYTYRVTKIGYSIGAGSFSTDTADVGSTHIQLTKLAVTTPPTPTITPVIIPTGTAGNYSGFWGPIAEGAKGAGAATNEIPLLLAALLIFIGFCVGGWSGAAYSPNSAFNGQASLGGGVFGFVLSCMFGFIPIVWVISIIIIGIFVFIFFTRS